VLEVRRTEGRYFEEILPGPRNGRLPEVGYLRGFCAVAAAVRFCSPLALSSSCFM